MSRPHRLLTTLAAVAAAAVLLVSGCSGSSPNTVQLRGWIVICGSWVGWGHWRWWERLAAHLSTLRLTTRGLARIRRAGLRRPRSLPMAHSHRAVTASRL